mmetsp:Transcript_18062/g.28726  ORF Transcript_18062/g.28726 Transcript_18062/m.28726 type:complete len:156 (+) Transcript_18062:235-702(+)
MRCISGLSPTGSSLLFFHFFQPPSAALQPPSVTLQSAELLFRFPTNRRALCAESFFCPVPSRFLCLTCPPALSSLVVTALHVPSRADNSPPPQALLHAAPSSRGWSQLDGHHLKQCMSALYFVASLLIGPVVFGNYANSGVPGTQGFPQRKEPHC